MNIYEKLAAVQQELKAPKDKHNTFGGYTYRSAEGILEAVKPLLSKYKALILLRDNVVEISGRFYVEAEAIFIDIESGEKLMTTGPAREAESKKGMDESQITGAASSYARKYALNGLLLIDDTKDADTDEYQKITGATKKTEKKAEPAAEKPAESLVSAAKVDKIRLLAAGAKVDLNAIMQKPVEALTDRQADALITSLERRMKGAE